MLIETEYPNLLHGCDFLCFNLMDCRVRFTGIKIENSRFRIKTGFPRSTHHSAFALIFHPYTPYSKLAAILVFFVFLQISPFASFLNSKFKRIFSFNEATRANLQVNKWILKSPPFSNKVHSTTQLTCRPFWIIACTLKYCFSRSKIQNLH